MKKHLLGQAAISLKIMHQICMFFTNHVHMCLDDDGLPIGRSTGGSRDDQVAAVPTGLQTFLLSHLGEQHKFIQLWHVMAMANFMK
jgi:hypothetical protein